MTEKNDNDSWQVFQQDVLDVFRQYEGFLDFFERVGSLSDDSRPDCFCRVSRKDKKEVWIVDAKNKSEIDQEDLERMEKYREMIEANPVDIGLEISELAEHQVRTVFVTPSNVEIEQNHEKVGFQGLHQFLQRELIYTDTDRVVRDVSRMMERRQLSQSQARLLFKSIKPFESKMKEAVETLERLENWYVGLELDQPPLSSYDFNIPVDAVLKHPHREKVFLFDVPYSRDALEELEEKVEEVRRRLENVDSEVFYSAINTFQPQDSDFTLQLEEVEEEVQQTAGIVSPEEVADLFTPKIPVEKDYTDKGIAIKDTEGIGFRASIETRDDIEHSVKIQLPVKAAENLREQCMNSPKNIGRIDGRTFRHSLSVTPELVVNYSDTEEPLDSYRSSIKSLYQSSVNPALAKKVSKTV